MLDLDDEVELDDLLSALIIVLLLEHIKLWCDVVEVGVVVDVGVQAVDYLVLTEFVPTDEVVDEVITYLELMFLEILDDEDDELVDELVELQFYDTSDELLVLVDEDDEVELIVIEMADEVVFDECDEMVNVVA